MHLLPGPPLTRRATFAAAAGSVALAAGCTPNAANAPSRRDARPRAPEPDPDVALAATVLADEQRLIDRIDATVARHQQLAALLTDPRAAHEAHVALLRDAAPDEPAPSPESSPGSSPSADAPRAEDTDRTPRAPRDPLRALRALARDEDDLALVDKRSAFAAESGAFARVLASMAASAAQHAVLLRTAPLPGVDAP